MTWQWQRDSPLARDKETQNGDVLGVSKRKNKYIINVHETVGGLPEYKTEPGSDNA